MKKYLNEDIKDCIVLCVEDMLRERTLKGREETRESDNEVQIAITEDGEKNV